MERAIGISILLKADDGVKELDTYNIEMYPIKNDDNFKLIYGEFCKKIEQACDELRFLIKK